MSFARYLFAGFPRKISFIFIILPWSNCLNRQATLKALIFVELFRNIPFQSKTFWKMCFSVIRHRLATMGCKQTQFSLLCREGHLQGVYSTNLWCGILGNKIIGPHLFRERLNGQVYLNFLRNILSMLLEEVDLQRRQSMQLQQDGTPFHFQRRETPFTTVYANKWIGMGSVNPWLPRSPYTTPLDYFLWGMVKDRVYQTSINNRQTIWNIE